MLAAAERWIDSRLAKIAITALIVISVLPDPALEDALRPLFGTVFTVELALRVALAARRPGRPRRTELAFLAIDVLALASFLPLERLVTPVDLTWLRILRVFRLLALLRYAEQLLASVYRAVTHREQLNQFWLVSVTVVASSFGAAVVLDQLAVPHEGAPIEPGAAGFLARMWWAFRQLESADNLVQTLSVHPVLAALSVGLTIFGVFLISYLIGIGANVVDQVVRSERRRPVVFGGHTVVLGSVAASEPLVRELVRLHAKNRRLLREWPKGVFRWLTQSGPDAARPVVPRVALVAEEEEPPAYLYEPGMARVAYRQGEGADPAALTRVGAKWARRALVLRDARAGVDADAVSLARLSALRAQTPHAHVFVEVERADHGEVVRAIGGEGTYVVDVPKLLGLFLCQHLVAPGMGPMLRELLSASGSEVYTHVFTGTPHGARADGGAAGPVATVSFERLAAHAHARHRVTLLGVLLGTEPVPPHPLGLVGADGLVLWLNPTDHPPLPCHVLGAKRGEIPVSSIRGFVGIAENYFPIRDFALEFERAGTPPDRGTVAATTPASAERLVAALAPRSSPLRRVLVVGYGPALPWLVRGLARFVTGVEVRIVLAVSSGQDAKLERWLDALRYGLEIPGLAAGVSRSIPGGGTLTVSTYEGPDRTGFAENALDAHGADAVVFLSDADAPDPDARVALQALKLVRAAGRAGHLEGRPMHLLVELEAAHRGESLRRELVTVAGPGADLRVTRVSTEEIRSYFMVQGALVPGVIEVYESLLGAPGQELVRLPVESRDDAEIPFAAIRDALVARRCLPIAIEWRDGSLEANPRHDRRVRPSAVTALVCLAKPARFAAKEPQIGKAAPRTAPVRELT